MKSTIEKLVAEGQKLAEKQSWIRKGWLDFWEKINNLPEVKNLIFDGIFESKIIYEWSEWNEWNDRMEMVAYRLIFSGTNDAEFFIKNEYIPHRRIGFDEVSIKEIREIVPSLVSAFQQILEKMQGLNGEYEVSIQTLEALVNKISA